MKRQLVASGLLAGMLTLAPGLAGADTITYQLGPDDFSGATDASGPIFVTLTDNLDGTVEMSVDASGLTGLFEFVGGLYLNFDPNLTLTGLSADHDSGADAGSPTIAANASNADGGGWFDILFNYSAGDLGLLQNTSVYTFTYTGTGTFNISSFNFFSDDPAPNGPHIMAAHIQGIGPTGAQSGWVGVETTTGTPTTGGQETTGGVPEPASVLLLGMGLLVAGRRLRRKIA